MIQIDQNDYDTTCIGNFPNSDRPLLEQLVKHVNDEDDALIFEILDEAYTLGDFELMPNHFSVHLVNTEYRDSGYVRRLWDDLERLRATLRDTRL